MLLVFFVFKRQDLFQPKLRSAATERALFDVLRVTVAVSGLLDPHHHRHLWPPVALLQANCLRGFPVGRCACKGSTIGEAPFTQAPEFFNGVGA